MGKLSVMQTCEKLPYGTRTECPYVVWLGPPCKVLKIDSNRWLLISYKQWLYLAHVFVAYFNETKGFRSKDGKRWITVVLVDERFGSKDDSDSYNY